MACEVSQPHTEWRQHSVGENPPKPEDDPNDQEQDASPKGLKLYKQVKDPAKLGEYANSVKQGIWGIPLY